MFLYFYKTGYVISHVQTTEEFEAIHIDELNEDNMNQYNGWQKKYVDETLFMLTCFNDTNELTYDNMFNLHFSKYGGGVIVKEEENKLKICEEYCRRINNFVFHLVKNEDRSSVILALHNFDDVDDSFNYMDDELEKNTHVCLTDDFNINGYVLK